MLHPNIYGIWSSHWRFDWIASMHVFRAVYWEKNGELAFEPWHLN